CPATSSCWRWPGGLPSSSHRWS
ncbi:MAG: hypothetical protein AVDCRST_MAG20-2146, partial [uncultured Acidimicrobiales bacterium]